jgi:hypothetical protein
MDFIKKFDCKRCSALNNGNRCSKTIMSFSNGIYLCEQHGLVIISPYNTILYNYLNEHSINKLYSNNYFKSNLYNRNLIKKRYRNVILNFLKKNLHIIDDIKYIIVKYL